MNKFIFILFIFFQVQSIAQTSLWSPLGKGLPDNPYLYGQKGDLVVFKDELYVPNYYDINSELEQGVRKWTGDRWEIINLDSLGYKFEIISITTDDSCLYLLKANGLNSCYNSSSPLTKYGLIKYDGKKWTLMHEFIIQENFRFGQMKWFKGELFLKAYQYSLVNSNCVGQWNNIYKWDKNNLINTNAYFVEGQGYVKCFLEKDSDLFIAGTFDSLNNKGKYYGIAKYNSQSNSWDTLKGASTFPSKKGIQLIYPYNDGIVATTYNLIFSSTPDTGIVLNAASYFYDGNLWTPMYALPTNQNKNESPIRISDFEYYNGQLYGFGDINMAGSVYIYNSLWTKILPSNFNNIIQFGAFVKDKLYVEGWFDRVDNLEMNYMARFDSLKMLVTIPPVANWDSITFDMDKSDYIDIPVTKNDFDIDPQDTILTVGMSFYGLSNYYSSTNGSGTVIGNKRNIIRFEKWDQYQLSARNELIYSLYDGRGGVDTALVIINAISKYDGSHNYPPRFKGKEYETMEETPITFNFTKGDFDIEGDTLSWEVPIENTPNAKITRVGKDSIFYEPNKDFQGIDYVKYILKDSAGGVTNANVKVIVNNTYDSLSGRVDSIFIKEDFKKSLKFINYVNTNEPEKPSHNILKIPVNGNLTLSQSTDYDFIYQPYKDFNGMDSMKLEFCDIKSFCDTSMVYFFIQPGNDAPVANSDTVYVSSGGIVGINFLKNDVDIDSKIYFDTLLSTPKNGNAVLQTDSLIEYLAQNFIGRDTIVYRIRDEGGLKSTSNIYIFVGLDGIRTDEINNNSKLIIYPNPNRGVVFADWNGGWADHLSLQIYDNLGKKIAEFPMVNSVLKFELPKNIVSGIYSIVLYKNNFPLARKRLAVVR